MAHFSAAVSKQDEQLIEKEAEVNRVICNTCLGELLKDEKSMKRTKRFKKLMGQYRAISDKLDQAEKEKDKKTIIFLTSEKKGVQNALENPLPIVHLRCS